MSEVKLSKQQQDAAIVKLQEYFQQELDRDLGQFEAEFLLEFIMKEVGSSIYNQALYDAQSLLTAKIEDVFAEIEQLDSL
ncbi:hypothetical protein GCM10008107_20930 [Psychrosphaera saromensis]|jgi:uncharacterized protein (DUF2164 family)|uniref:DUF2164 domain-containing protein n=1 Tax=Psychrosphaera saromensis TaxID=716813 RepID=A0A2S7US60_9GAMM|nr:DUF2164 domain-containing protein [Psychrosphaera saromensis]PQJ52783.1 hypothetical protein BTO11_03340 [Psychrosphaera saromensis]GHB71223.1 hypothetical protein GCM10008107_20930 [Psychrosphaera saromensis]GLQ13279.1 hypothetical protein GCM10007917_07340 [Psychrosphaera saromensis]